MLYRFTVYRTGVKNVKFRPQFLSLKVSMYVLFSHKIIKKCQPYNYFLLWNKKLLIQFNFLNWIIRLWTNFIKLWDQNLCEVSLEFSKIWNEVRSLGHLVIENYVAFLSWKTREFLTKNLKSCQINKIKTISYNSRVYT